MNNLKKIFLTIQLICITQFNLYSQCINSGVELNNFDNWTGFIGNYSGASLFQFNNINSGLSLSTTGLPSTGRIQIVSSGSDPLVSTLQKTLSGNFSIQLGNIGGNSNAERVIYNLLVTPSNKIFKYNYAVVLQEPSHNRRKNPFFWARVLNNNNNVICETGRKSSTANDPFFKSVPNSSLVYREWECVICDLSNYVGQNLRIEFTVADCSLGLHGGYAYIDGLCDTDPINLSINLPKDNFCISENIYFDGSLTTGEIDYLVSIEESDANFGRPNPSSEISKWFTNSQVGVFNLSSLIDKDKLKCNTYYRLKLAAKNSCTQWVEQVKLIKIVCPEIEVKDECCDSNLEIGYCGNNPVGTLYSWTPSNLVLNPNSCETLFKPSVSTTYPLNLTLTATTSNGCSIAKTMEICCTPPNASLIIKDNCCNKIIEVNSKDNCKAKYLWNTGETSKSIIVSTAGTYTCRVSNTCGTIILTTIITPNEYITGEFKELIIPNAFTPNGDGLNDIFKILEFDPNTPTEGQGPAYNATDFELIIFNRWGQAYVASQGSNCQGLVNGQIRWDGKINGVLVDEGIYTWQLRMKNCSNPEWVTTFKHFSFCEICERRPWQFWKPKYFCCDNGTNHVIRNNGSIAVIFP